MTIALIEQILFLVALVIVAAVLRRCTPLGLPLASVLTGFLAGLAVATFNFDTGIRAYSLQDIVFYVIIPVLIFEAAWHLKPALLRRWLPAILLLATVGVVVSCVVTAALVFIGIDHPQGYPWLAALLTGAILAATDPVSVIGQLKDSEAPRSLVTLFEGESLFNDATAVVLFSVILAFAIQPGAVQHNTLASYFAMVFVGGVLVGVAAGALCAALVRLLGQPSCTTVVLLFTAFGTFYLAEHVLQTSGILAVMFAALITRSMLAGVEDSVAAGLGATWEWLGELFNGLLFIVMGLVITVGMFESHWLAMLIAIAAALVARACAVAVCGLLSLPLASRLPWRWQLLLIWGGQRGAIALALVLALPVSLAYWYTVQSMVFGVVLFGLLVQGTSSGILMRRLTTGADSDKAGPEPGV